MPNRLTIMKQQLDTSASPASPQDWIPHAYQKRAVRFLLKYANAGLFLDPGLGKTSIALKAFDTLLKEGLAKRMLVIAPLRPVYEVWPVQIDQWNQFKHLRWSILHGHEKDYDIESDADIFVMNPDGLPWLIKNRILRVIQPDILNIDESSKFRHPKTRRFKLLKPYLEIFQRRWILTGSPTPKSYMDLFGQIYILDLGNALGQFITHFRATYFLPTGYMGHDYRLQPGAEKAIQRAIKPLVLRLDADDYVSVPKEIPDVRRITLPPNARDVYDRLETEMFAELDRKHVVTAVNAAVASMKCCQVASGGVYVDRPLVDGDKKKRIAKHIHHAKTEALEELIDELQGVPLLLGFEFDHDLERILSILPKNTPYIKGGMNPKLVNQIIQAWNQNRITVLPCNVASVSHGLNLQEGQCQHVAFYTIPWNFDDYDQFIRRVRRQGNQHNHVIVHHFVARDTVDEVKLRDKRSKAHTQKTLLDALRSYIKSRRPTDGRIHKTKRLGVHKRSQRPGSSRRQVVRSKTGRN